MDTTISLHGQELVKSYSTVPDPISCDPISFLFLEKYYHSTIEIVGVTVANRPHKKQLILIPG